MKKLEPLAKYLTGPLFLVSAGLWMHNGEVLSGVAFIVAGLMFCWIGYDYYKERKNSKDR